MSTTPVRPLTPRQRALFEKLLSQFLDHGFADFTIDSAARDLRCSKTTLYALGATRDDIVRRIVISFFEQVAARTEASLHNHSSYSAQFTAYFQAIVQALAPASPAFMSDLGTDPVGQEVFAKNTDVALQRINKILAAGVASGEFRTVATTFVARIADDTMHQIRLGHFEDILPAQDAYRELGDLLLHGLVAR